MVALGGTRDEAQKRNVAETRRWETVIDSARIVAE
jgi:hypothetical protein